MYGIVRHTLAIVAVLCLESFTGQSSVGQVPKGAQASTAAPAETSRDAGESLQTGYDAERARALYLTNCSACHGTNGEGQPGTYPPIKGSGVVTKDDATKHMQVVLNGMQGAKAGGVLYDSPMPPFAGLLSDVEIAESRQTGNRRPGRGATRPFQVTEHHVCRRGGLAPMRETFGAHISAATKTARGEMPGKFSPSNIADNQIRRPKR